MIGFLAEQIASFYLGDKFASFMSNIQEKKKLERVEAVISTILEAEKDNVYYNSLDRILSTGKLIDDFGLKYSSHSKDAIRTRIDEALSRDKGLSGFDRQRISEVIFRIFTQAREVLLEPDSPAEKRADARLKDESTAIQEAVRKGTSEIKDILQKQELTDDQYSLFEEKVIQLYLQGQINALGDTIIEMDSWVQLALPVQLNALIFFLKIVTGYHEQGTISSREVSSYLSQESTSSLDKLFATFLLCFGDKVNVEQLLNQREKARWLSYQSLFDLVNNPRELTFAELTHLDAPIDVLSAAILKSNLRNLQVYANKEFFNQAYQVLPMPWVSRFMLASEHLWHAHMYDYNVYNHALLMSCRDRAERFLQLSSFFCLTTQEIKKQFYREFAEFLSYCDADYIRDHLKEVQDALNDEVQLISLYIEYWKMQQHIPEAVRIEQLLNASLSQNNHDAHIKLLDFLLINNKNSEVYSYLDERKFVLKEDIRYLQIAIDVGFSPDLLMRYEKEYEGNLQYYCLCDKHLNENEKQKKNYPELAVNAFFKNPLCLIDYMRELLQYAYDQNRLDEFESMFTLDVPLVVWRIRAHFYKDVVHDNKHALECIRKVVDSPIVIGADYALLGRLTTSTQEAYRAFEKGYQEHHDVNCLYEQLWMDYQHRTINETLLQDAAQIDDCAVQNLLTHCYKQLDQAEKVRQHSIRAALLCKEYQQNIMLQLTMFFIENDKEEISDSINDHSHVILMDETQKKVNICFYPAPEMLPKKPSVFANAQHYFADYKNLWYSQLRGRKAGQELLIDNTKYTIVAVDSTYVFLTRYCMGQLLENKAMFQISGSPEELWDKMYEITADSAKESERLLEQYTKNDNNYVGYRSFVHKTGTSYLATLNTLVECHFPLRSVRSNDLLYPEGYIVGLDTLFLLSKLPLTQSELDLLCEKMVMSESAYGYYHSGQIEDFNRQAHSAGYLQLINGRMQLSEQDANDPCVQARELYSSLTPIIERVSREKAMFEFPANLREKGLSERLSDSYGQPLFDNFQLTSDQRYIVLNDRAEVFIYHALGRSTPICTIMNLLALDDVSLLSKISCFEKLVELRYHGVLSYSFFHVINKQLNELKQDGDLDTYESYLTRLIGAVVTILDKKDPCLGDMCDLLKLFNTDGSLSDDLPKLLTHLFMRNLPEEVIARFSSSPTKHMME